MTIKNGQKIPLELPFAGRISGARCLQAALILLVLCCACLAQAQEPLPFSAEYEARFGGFRARAERSLAPDGMGGYEMATYLELKFLGATVSSIRERSVLLEDAGNHEARPVDYTFKQTGLGKRSRSISFDWEQNSATALVNDREIEIPLEGKVFDNLSAYLEVRRQLVEGKTEIVFPAIDKDELEEFRFRVIGEETVETRLGPLRTLKLVRVREPGSDRTTEFWLALEWDYLLVKLLQEEPGSRTITLELKEATMDGQAVTGASG